MKNCIFYLSLFVAFLGNCQYQTNSNSKLAVEETLPTHQERYGIDYKLYDYVFINGDSTVLDLLDLDALESLRSQTVNIEAVDPNTGLIVVLFFEKKKKGASSETIKFEE